MRSVSRSRAHAAKAGMLAGLIIVFLGIITELLGPAGNGTSTISVNPWRNVALGATVVLFLMVGYEATRNGGALLLGGLAGAIAGAISGAGLTIAFAVGGAFTTHPQVEALWLAAGIGVLYAIFLVAPVGTCLGVCLGFVGGAVSLIRH